MTVGVIAACQFHLPKGHHFDRTGNRAVSNCAIAERGTVMHLEGYGIVRVFRIITPESETEHWATNDEQMHELARLRYVEDARGIEAYHRALKQGCRAEQAMVRSGQAQCNHPLASGYPGMAIRAGCPLGRMRLQWHRVRTGIGLGMAKEGIIRRAVRFSLTRPWYTLPATA